MKIKKLELINFKRFTHLVINHIPEKAKLVLLIGANGSGKSSVFDGFDYLNKGIFKSNYTIEPENYYPKNKSSLPQINIELADGTILQKVGLTHFQNQEIAKRFIGRSSVRIIPRIINQSNLSSIATDNDSPASFIENDTRFINDVFSYIQKINEALQEPVFSGKQADTLKIFSDFIDPLNSSLLNIFGGTPKTTIQIIQFRDATSNTPPQLIFKKGESRITYDLLSHGEKQVIILLLNFIVRQEFYSDAILFIDEMDCHLNTALQYNLLQEITEKWIPENTQLWTASHALGFIDYARHSENAVTIDLNLHDFDDKIELVPVIKDNLDVYNIAAPVALLLNLITEGRRVLICENQNDKFYNLLGLPNCIFTGVKDSRSVFLDIKRDSRYQSLRDRDFLSDKDIEKLKKIYPNHHILKYYDFENYLYHPNNIAELNPDGFDIKTYINEIKRQKKEKVHYILPKIQSARQTYEEFKTESKLNYKDTNDIVDDLISDDFERFYKFFDMKEQFDKTYLSTLNIDKQHLASTLWLKQQIQQILNI